MATRARMWAWAVGTGVTATKKFARKIREQAAKPPRRKASKPQAEPEAQVEVEEHEAEPQTQAESQTEAAPQTETEAQTAAAPQTEGEPQVQAGPEVEEPQVQAGPQVEEPRVETEPKTEFESVEVVGPSVQREPEEISSEEIHDQNRVDCAGEDSFPASDPPGWTSSGAR